MSCWFCSTRLRVHKVDDRSTSPRTTSSRMCHSPENYFFWTMWWNICSNDSVVTRLHDVSYYQIFLKFLFRFSISLSSIVIIFVCGNKRVGDIYVYVYIYVYKRLLRRHRTCLYRVARVVISDGPQILLEHFFFMKNIFTSLTLWKEIKTFIFWIMNFVRRQNDWYKEYPLRQLIYFRSSLIVHIKINLIVDWHLISTIKDSFFIIPDDNSLLNFDLKNQVNEKEIEDLLVSSHPSVSIR